MKQVSYTKNNKPTLYLVATPIGNLQEINPRMVETLNKVALILCEDTRVSGKLLQEIGVHKPLKSYHLHNEYELLDEVIADINKLHDIALISDAGYPLISDPGYLLVQQALAHDINIVVVNGSNALLPALLNSGFNTTPFTFVGFLSHKSQQAKEELTKYQSYQHTIIIYEAIHRLQRTLRLIMEVLGDVPIAISRELTKRNEEVTYGKVSEVLARDLTLKGELVIVVDNSTAHEKTPIDDDTIIEAIEALIATNTSKKDAIKEISKRYGLEKNYVYDLFHKKK
jgi:16S rRNA (cytidine1402-2'-O)-methyltransferase